MEQRPERIADARSEGPEDMPALLGRKEAHALIAHELRAPLTVIQGYTGILARPMDDASRAAALAALERATTRLDTLLDDLLATSGDSRVFAPRLVETVRLRDIAQDVVDELAPLHDHLIEVSGDAGSLRCDPRLVRQVIWNLVSNATKHTPTDGHVVVSVCDAPDEVTVLVEDDGPGVPDAEREAVFELFTRLGAPDDMPPGLGLGLTVSRAIVEQHGGTLALTNSCDASGACFEMRLPRE